MQPHLVILHDDRINPEIFSELIDRIQVNSLKLEVLARPYGPFAGIEWLMPTAIVVYITKPYFESFLKEMGKDHYVLLKAGLKKLYTRVADPDSPKLTIVATQGKAAAEQPYALFFSLVTQGPNRREYKLLLRSTISELEYDAAIDEFMNFVEEMHTDTLDAAGGRLLMAPSTGNVVLVTYNAQNGCLVSVDPLERK